MILDRLSKAAACRVRSAQKSRPLADLRREAEALEKGSFAFEKALTAPEMTFICEIKKASPSKGIISEDFPYCAIAKAYEAAGAHCLSVLTEPQWFMGSDAIFREIRHLTTLPMLRKDFTVDPYQLYEAKVMGADAVLLICTLLDIAALCDYLAICDALGLTALVETHDVSEITAALTAGARVIGVNNRNLKNFTVNLDNAAALRAAIPKNNLFIAESGIRTPSEVRALAEIGADAVLIGEALMRAEDKATLLHALQEAAHDAH